MGSDSRLKVLRSHKFGQTYRRANLFYQINGLTAGSTCVFRVVNSATKSNGCHNFKHPYFTIRQLGSIVNIKPSLHTNKNSVLLPHLYCFNCSKEIYNLVLVMSTALILAVHTSLWRSFLSVVTPLGKHLTNLKKKPNTQVQQILKKTKQTKNQPHTHLPNNLNLVLYK